MSAGALSPPPHPFTAPGLCYRRWPGSSPSLINKHTFKFSCKPLHKGRMSFLCSCSPSFFVFFECICVFVRGSEWAWVKSKFTQLTLTMLMFGSKARTWPRCQFTSAAACGEEREGRWPIVAGQWHSLVWTVDPLKDKLGLKFMLWLVLSKEKTGIRLQSCSRVDWNMFHNKKFRKNPKLQSTIPFLLIHAQSMSINFFSSLHKTHPNKKKTWVVKARGFGSAL